MISNIITTLFSQEIMDKPFEDLYEQLTTAEQSLFRELVNKADPLAMKKFNASWKAKAVRAAPTIYTAALAEVITRLRTPLNSAVQQPNTLQPLRMD